MLTVADVLVHASDDAPCSYHDLPGSHAAMNLLRSESASQGRRPQAVTLPAIVGPI